MKTAAGLRRHLGLLCAALVVSCASMPRPLPAPDVFSAEVLAGRLDLEHFDFEAAGYWKRDSTSRLVWLGDVQRAVFGTRLDSDTCDLNERRRFAAVMWLVVVQQSAEAETWRANYAALRRALLAHDELVSAAAAKIEPAQDARVTELRRRVARDQAIRDLPRLDKLAEGMPDLSRQHWVAIRLGRMMAIDCDNTEWLAAQMREIGWFDIPRYGARANQDAWLLVQHADRNKPFQRETLAYLEKLPPGMTEPRNIALLFDRVAIGEGRMQRYGTQGKCLADGSWVPHDVENVAELDARRQAIGLMPMADYIKGFDGICPRATK